MIKEKHIEKILNLGKDYSPLKPSFLSVVNNTKQAVKLESYDLAPRHSYLFSHWTSKYDDYIVGFPLTANSSLILLKEELLIESVPFLPSKRGFDIPYLASSYPDQDWAPLMLDYHFVSLLDGFHKTITLTESPLPQNEKEILLSQHLRYKKGYESEKNESLFQQRKKCSPQFTSYCDDPDSYKRNIADKRVILVEEKEETNF